MKISRFQLKLTLIFLVLLLIPATLAMLITRHILTMEQTGVDVDRRVEEVLQEASEIAYDIIEAAKVECQGIAEGISSDEVFLEAFSASDELGGTVTEIAPHDPNISVIIFDFKTDLDKGTVRFTSSSKAENIPYSIIDSLKQNKVSQAHQEKDMVYGIAPILEAESLTGAVIVFQRLKQELVRNIIGLQNILRGYALKPDLEYWIWVEMIAMFASLAAIGTILGWVIAKTVTKPILSLVNGTQEIAKGNLDHKVDVEGKDEIATLVESFNSMTSQLKTSKEREVRAERLAAWRDVARRIAHEIKNPLTPIQLSMYRLRKNLGSERYGDIFQQAYTSITNEVENLRNMVTEFSDFARMPKPRTKLADPKKIVQDAIDLYTGLPDNISLRAELEDDLPQVMADADQIRQVLHNLIGNAVDAMTDGGQLSVMMCQKADDIAIEISDTGCGISEEVMERIFTPYFTTKETGTGLGMAITAQIIEEHGGEIAIESAEGVGTTVTVMLKTDIDNDEIVE